MQENWRSDGVRKLEDVLKDIEPLGARAKHRFCELPRSRFGSQSKSF